MKFDELLEEYWRLEKEATSGPWGQPHPPHFWCNDEGDWVAIGPAHRQDEDELDPDSGAGKKAQADSFFIAASRNTAPEIIRRQSRIIEVLREGLEKYRDNSSYVAGVYMGDVAIEALAEADRISDE